MSKQIEALKLALEALEGFEPNTFIGSDAELLCHTAIAAIREALTEQPAPFVLTGIDCWCGRKWRITNNTLTASEPAHVATVNTLSERVANQAQNVHVQAAQQQEPVAWMNKHGACMSAVFKEVDATAGEYTTPLYTSPQSKPWVGLTNQELIDLTAIYSGAPLYSAIEAKLKERNT